jgi:hypothetical protein
MHQMANMAAFTKVVGTDTFSAAAARYRCPKGARHQADPRAGKLACRVSDRTAHRARCRELSGAELSCECRFTALLDRSRHLSRHRLSGLMPTRLVPRQIGVREPEATLRA